MKPPDRVLIVEDDGRILEELVAAFRQDGFDPLPARTLGAARAHLGSAPTLVLLDLGLPDGDGLDLCEELGRSQPDTPLILLTARDGVEDRVRGLDAGADDYVVKPCNLNELLARVRSVLRRSRRSHPGGMVRWHELWLDPDALLAGKGPQSLDLKPKEFDLLSFLLRHPDRPWTREQILDRVWGLGYEGDARTVDVHVRRLRQKIEDDPGRPRYLLTEWGVGYRMGGEG